MKCFHSYHRQSNKWDILFLKAGEVSFHWLWPKRPHPPGPQSSGRPLAPVPQPWCWQTGWEAQGATEEPRWHDLRAELPVLLGDVSLRSPATIIGAPRPAPRSLPRLTSPPPLSCSSSSPPYPSPPLPCWSNSTISLASLPISSCTTTTEELSGRGREDRKACNNSVMKATPLRWRHLDTDTHVHTDVHTDTHRRHNTKSNTNTWHCLSFDCSVDLLASMCRADPSLL